MSAFTPGSDLAGRQQSIDHVHISSWEAVDSANHGDKWLHIRISFLFSILPVNMIVDREEFLFFCRESVRICRVLPVLLIKIGCGRPCVEYFLRPIRMRDPQQDYPRVRNSMRMCLLLFLLTSQLVLTSESWEYLLLINFTLHIWRIAWLFYFACSEKILQYGCRLSGEPLHANPGKLNTPRLYLGTRHVHCW